MKIATDHRDGPSGSEDLAARLAEAEKALEALHAEVARERALNRRLAETEKMAAIGLLAGSVAHEINNPLGGILAFAQLMKRDQGRTPGDLESLDMIEESALRCKRIVESLQRFARGGSKPEDRRRFDLNRCVDDACLLFRAHLRSTPQVSLEVRLEAPEGASVLGDSVHLAQVVHGLLQNALQSLPNALGVISVRTFLEGDLLAITVTDTGEGISPEHLPRIFEPAFTTRPPGGGIGMGLSIAYRIVKDHGGEFQVRSQPGAGSTFTVLLPSKKG